MNRASLCFFGRTELKPLLRRSKSRAPIDMHQPALYDDFRPPRRIALLSGEATEEVLAYLGRDPVSNLFKLSWLENYGICAPGRPDLFHFRAVRNADRLMGVALLITNRLALLHTEDAQTARTLGRWHRDRGVRLEHIVSRRQSVTPFWNEYGASPDVRARLVRDQELYAIERNAWIAQGPPPPNRFEGNVRLARHADVPAIFLASARMHAEETLEDPLERDAAHFRRHVEHRIENGRTYAWFDDHRRLLFKADISAQSPWGAQISGVYTPPALRGQGIATRGMFDVCEALFQRGFPRVTLYVNRTNAAARRVYEKVGFDYHTDYQTVFVESAPR